MPRIKVTLRWNPVDATVYCIEDVDLCRNCWPPNSEDLVKLDFGFDLEESERAIEIALDTGEPHPDYDTLYRHCCKCNNRLTKADN